MSLAWALVAGAGDENRTRALSLGSFRFPSASAQVSAMRLYGGATRSGSPLTSVDPYVPLLLVRQWCADGENPGDEVVRGHLRLRSAGDLAATAVDRPGQPSFEDMDVSWDGSLPLRGPARRLVPVCAAVGGNGLEGAIHSCPQCL